MYSDKFYGIGTFGSEKLETMADYVGPLIPRESLIIHIILRKFVVCELCESQYVSEPSKYVYIK